MRSLAITAGVVLMFALTIAESAVFVHAAGKALRWVLS